jgi:ribokinase
LSAEHVDGLATHLEGVDVVLLQLECPLPAVVRAMERAKDAGAIVILNPSPWQDAGREHCVRADILIVNEGEGSALGDASDPARVSELRNEIGCEVLIVTRGALPIRVASDGDDYLEVAPPAITPVDTVGAGDAFAGVFAVAFAEGRSLLESVKMASVAAALATLKPGAQRALPTREEILDVLDQT